MFVLCTPEQYGADLWPHCHAEWVSTEISSHVYRGNSREGVRDQTLLVAFILYRIPPPTHTHTTLQVKAMKKQNWKTDTETWRADHTSARTMSFLLLSIILSYWLYPLMLTRCQTSKFWLQGWVVFQRSCKTFISRGYLHCSQAQCGEQCLTLSGGKLEIAPVCKECCWWCDPRRHFPPDLCFSSPTPCLLFLPLTFYPRYPLFLLFTLLLSCCVAHIITSACFISPFNPSVLLVQLQLFLDFFNTFLSFGISTLFHSFSPLISKRLLLCRSVLKST